jgi:hypothetical protein
MATRGYTGRDGRVSVFDPTINPTAQTGLWRTCPMGEYLHDPSVGILLIEDFQNYDATATTGDYLLTQATTGTGAISTAAPGVLELDSASSTATQGANLQRIKSCFLPAANKSIWFEAKVKVVDTFDKCELFVGLSELDTTMLATSANSSANHIGWQCVTDNGVLLFVSEKATVVTTQASVTIAENTYVRLGFFYDGAADTLTQYVNGVRTGTAIATANIPKVALFPSFVCQSGGTNDPIMHIAGYRIIQLA